MSDNAAQHDAESDNWFEIAPSTESDPPIREVVSSVEAVPREPEHEAALAARWILILTAVASIGMLALTGTAPDPRAVGSASPLAGGALTAAFVALTASSVLSFYAWHESYSYRARRRALIVGALALVLAIATGGAVAVAL